jgi:hypothetical protein
MLRDEDNAKYRLVLKNTLEFDPQILKRYVNFMNNPDERTAVDQFGKGDKYFGICTMMVTMPGLPMFGHGQVEGFTEKYGMEYRRAYWDEQPDSYLVERHEREIFPLLRQRVLFAGVANFLLYDLFTPQGYVNEDVFAYSNRAGDERALVVYHNKYAETQGWIRTSAAYAVRAEPEGEADRQHAADKQHPKVLVQKSLGEGLALREHEDFFTIFRDHVTGLEYIRGSREIFEKGLYVELGAYQYHVFLGFRQVQDNEWHHYAQLTAYLDGRGVPSIEEALREILLRPVHCPFQELVNADLFHRLMDAGVGVDEALVHQVEQRSVHLLREAKQLSGGSGDEVAIAREIRHKLEAILGLPLLASRFSSQPQTDLSLPQLQQDLVAGLRDDPSAWPILLGWLFTHALGKVVDGTDSGQISRSWSDEWLLGKVIAGALQDLGLDVDSATRAVTTIKILTSHQRWFEEHDVRAGPPANVLPEEERAHRVLESWLKDEAVRQFLKVHRYPPTPVGGVLWFNKEAFDELLWWMLLLVVVVTSADPLRSKAEVVQEIEACHSVVRELQQAEEESGYQVEGLLEAAKAKSHGETKRIQSR